MGTIKRTFANNLTSAGKINSTNLDGDMPASNVANSSVTNVTEVSPSIGAAIKGVAGNPPSPSQSLGDMWYDTNLGVLKNVGQSTAAWASGGSLNTSSRDRGGSGPQTAAIVFGGQPQPGQAPTANTETYDGSSWTEVGNLNTGRSQGAPAHAGSQTATLYAGGGVEPPGAFVDSSEEYDGTSWSEGNNLVSGAAGQTGGGGTQTAGLKYGGKNPSTTGDTEEYDGTSWSEVNNMNTARRQASGAGPQTANLASGGNQSPSNVVEEYDGTSWTNGGSLVDDGRHLGGSGGSSTSGVFFAGVEEGPGNYTVKTEVYDGTSWAVSANMASARQRITGMGSASAAMGAAGYPPSSPKTNAVEEFTGIAPTIKTVTTST